MSEGQNQSGCQIQQTTSEGAKPKNKTHPLSPQAEANLRRRENLNLKHNMNMTLTNPFHSEEAVNRLREENRSV